MFVNSKDNDLKFDKHWKEWKIGTWTSVSFFNFSVPAYAKKNLKDSMKTGVWFLWMYDDVSVKQQ